MVSLAKKKKTDLWHDNERCVVSHGTDDSEFLPMSFLRVYMMLVYPGVT